MIRRVLGLALALGLAAQPVVAQTTVGAGVDYMGYTFDAGLGADAAQLFMIPVAVRVPITDRFTANFFAAWAEGRVEQNNTQLKLSGPVDSNLKLSYQATPWALVSIGANLPTGTASHDAEEAVVASVLATDLLSFRESSWGTGFAMTTSVATATTAGGFGLGIAGAYAMRGEFEPSATQAIAYKPGSETRVRIGVDRNFGNSTLTLGGTLINYSEDQANGANLFQAGKRIRLDGSYAFRAGDGVWTLYAANVIRDNGDLTLDIVDGLGNVVGDTTAVTAKQNLLVGGVIGTVGLGGGFVFRPHLDFKLQSREEDDGSDPGSGWILAAGGDIPVRLFGGEFFPKARVFFGSIRDVMMNDVSVFGMEFKGTMRFNF